MVSQKPSYSYMLGQCLRRAKMSQADLARALGCKETLVSHWMKGHSVPITKTQRRIEEILPEMKEAR